MSIPELRIEGSVIDGHGIVHRIDWVDRTGSTFSVACRARILDAPSQYYSPSNERPSCMLCLAEIATFHHV